jgi:hypothetical protein
LNTDNKLSEHLFARYFWNQLLVSFEDETASNKKCENWHHVTRIQYKFTSISREHTASIFRDEE